MRPRTRACSLVSAGLGLASLVALDHLARGSVQVLPWADFICWGILICCVISLVITLSCAVSEQPRRVTWRYRDPNYDPSEL